MLRIAICDDDLIFLNNFARMITTSFADAGQQAKVFTFSDGKSLIEKVEKEKQFFDVIFLDVEMPVVHGFQVAQRLRELNAVFILIFTTYIEHQSREGYLYGAFRYVFKNNLEAEINEAVSGIIKKLDNPTIDQEEVTFKCRTSGVFENLTVRQVDILFLKKEKSRRVILKTVYSEYELLIRPLSEYAELLKPPIFIQIMRNFIVNFDHVQGVSADCFILTGNITIPLGIKYEVKMASIEKYHRFLEERI